LAELGQGIGIALLGELEEDLRLIDPLPLALEARDRVQHRGRLAADGLRLLCVVPEPGGGGLLAQLARTPLETGQVKGASRARRPARAGRGRARGGSRAASGPSCACPPPLPPAP